MVDTYLKFENGKFLDKEGQDLSKKYDLSDVFYSDGALVSERYGTRKFKVLKEIKRSSHRYLVIKDEDNVIFPVHLVRLKDEEERFSISHVSSKSTREKLYGQMAEDEDIKKVEEEHHIRPDAESPTVDDSKYKEENEGDIFSYNTIRERQEYFAKIPSFDKQMEIINKLFEEKRIYDASVLINNGQLEEFYKLLSPEEMKRLFTVLADNADKFTGKDKNDLMDDLSSILDLYPRVNELCILFEGNNKQQERLFDALSPDKLKEIYNNGDQDVKKRIDDYLAFNIICYGMLVDAAKGNKKLFKEGSSYYSKRDKRVPFSSKERELFGLNKASSKEIEHYNRVQTYVKKYNMIPHNADEKDRIKVYDISKITAVPSMDRTKFKFHQHAYLRKYDARQANNVKIIKDTLSNSMNVAQDKINEYNYMLKHAQAKHKAVHSLFKRKAFNDFLKSKSSEMQSMSISDMYKLDKTDVQILECLKKFLQVVDKQEDKRGVRITNTPNINATNVENDRAIRTVVNDKIGQIRDWFNKIGKRNSKVESRNENLEEEKEQEQVQAVAR